MAKPLTVKSVENARPSAKRAEIADGDLPGLRLVIQPSGAKSWAYRYRAAGSPKKLTLGSFPQIRLADARDLARAAARTVAEGNDPAQKKRAARETADTFEDVARRFLRRHCRPNYSPRHFLETARLFGFKPDPEDPHGLNLIHCGYAKALIKKWGKRPIGSVKERELVDFLDDIVDGGTPVLANNMHTALSKFFAWAKSPSGGRAIEVNPCLEIKQPAKDRRGERTLSDAELRALWRAAMRLGYPKGSAYRMLILTGQRKTIVGQCRKEQIDRREGLWTISAHQEGAKGTGHTLPITSAIAAVFDECGDAAPYLFSTTGGEKPLYLGDKVKQEIDALMLEELRKEAESEGFEPGTVQLPDWDNHDIRRSFRSRLSALPIPKAADVNELLIGHRLKTLNAIYNKYEYLDEKRIGLDLWAAKLESIVNPQSGNVVEFKPKAVAL